MSQGTHFTYSDAGYILLAFVVECVLGASLDELARDRVFEPLEMSDTRFGVAPEDVHRCAPTELVDGVPLRGVVHDPNCRAMGSVAGHAGVFGTAADLANYCRMILDRGRFAGSSVSDAAYR